RPALLRRNCPEVGGVYGEEGRTPLRWLTKVRKSGQEWTPADTTGGVAPRRIMAQKGKHAADPEILKALSFGATVEAAAAKAGVSARTVRRRLRDPRFVRKLNRLRAEGHVRTADQLSAVNSEAVRTLVQLLQAANSGQVRLGAARSVLELSVKHRET